MTEFKIEQKGQSKEMPAKVVLYGVPKIGKTTFASQADDVFFIDIEGGLDYLDNKVSSTPKLKSFNEVLDWFKHVYDAEEKDFPFKTIAIDSMDWLEKLAQSKLCKEYSASSIQDPACKAFGYGKGLFMAAEEAQKVLAWVDAIYNKKGIKCILIAHSEVKAMDLPNKDPYSKFVVKLSKQLGAKVNEWADLILFADYDFFVDKDGKTSEPKPVLLAGGSPSFEGGGRMKLANKIPLDYQALVKNIKGE